MGLCEKPHFCCYNPHLLPLCWLSLKTKGAANISYFFHACILANLNRKNSLHCSSEACSESVFLSIKASTVKSLNFENASFNEYLLKKILRIVA